MKKILFYLLFVLFISTPSFAETARFYVRSALTTALPESLDSINTSDMPDKSLAKVNDGSYIYNYEYDQSSSAAESSPSIITPNTGIGRWILIATDKYYKVNVKDPPFNAVGDGVTDDTAAIQAAIDYAETVGFSVFIPSGTYLVSATLTIDSPNVAIIGENMANAIITRATDYGDTFYFTGTAATVLTDVGISNLSFKSTALMTSGAHISMDGVARANIQNINITQSFVGFNFSATTALVVDNIYAVFTNNYGGVVSGRTGMKFVENAAYTGHPSCGDVFVSNFNLRGNASALAASNTPNYGIQIDSGDGIWFSNGHVGNMAGGDIFFSNSSIEDTSLIFFENVMCDAHGGASVLFNGSSAIIRNVQFTNCHLKGGSTGLYGVLCQVGAVATNIQFTGGSIQEHQRDGVRNESAEAYNWTFSGMQVRGNNLVAGTYNGFLLSEGAKWQIVGGVSGGHATTRTGTGTQDYGIELGANVTGITISAIDCTNNVTGSIDIDAAALAEVDVILCKGYVNRNSGTGSITSGVTTDVITHGLDVTPTAANINITFTESTTADPGNIWVDTITATNFTVNCRTDPGASNLDFSWQAIVL